MLTVGERMTANGSKAFREEQPTDAFIRHHLEAKYVNERACLYNDTPLSLAICAPSRCGTGTPSS